MKKFIALALALALALVLFVGSTSFAYASDEEGNGGIPDSIIELIIGALENGDFGGDGGTNLGWPGLWIGGEMEPSPVNGMPCYGDDGSGLIGECASGVIVYFGWSGGYHDENNGEGGTPVEVPNSWTTDQNVLNYCFQFSDDPYCQGRAN